MLFFSAGEKAPQRQRKSCEAEQVPASAPKIKQAERLVFFMRADKAEGLRAERARGLNDMIN